MSGGLPMYNWFNTAVPYFLTLDALLDMTPGSTLDVCLLHGWMDAVEEHAKRPEDMLTPAVLHRAPAWDDSTLTTPDGYGGQDTLPLYMDFEDPEVTHLRPWCSVRKLKQVCNTLDMHVDNHTHVGWLGPCIPRSSACSLPSVYDE